MNKVKIPKNVKTTPRCPLCKALFDRKVIPSRQAHLSKMVDEALEKYREAATPTEVAKAKEWGEMLEAAIKAGAAEAFLCHYCKISIACNDPFIGRWDEAYAKGEKMLCPACDHEMRFFCTSTGYVQFKCPVKKCQSKMETTLPDRGKDGPKQLFDDKGDAIMLPNITDAVATPNDMSDAQIGGSGKDAALPDVTTILPKGGGNA